MMITGFVPVLAQFENMFDGVYLTPNAIIAAIIFCR